MDKQPKLISEFIPFSSALDHPNIVEPVVQNTTIKDIEKILQLQISSIRASKTGRDIALQIFNFLISNDIRLGPKQFVLSNKKGLMQTIRKNIAINRPIPLTILGIPFKIPNPLKTNTALPDLGELLFLNRLSFICECIQKIYAPGAIFYFCKEGLAFKDFVGVPEPTVMDYYKGLDLLINLFDIKSIQFVELTEITPLEPNFDSIYKKRVREFEKKYLENDSEIKSRVKAVYPVISASINTNRLSIRDAAEIYSHVKLPKKYDNQAVRGAIKYLAYHQTRKDTNLMQHFFPNSITCTVAPKPGVVGLIPVAPKVKLLPYHGVPVIENNQINIKYYIDIITTKTHAWRLNIPNSSDQSFISSNFYYTPIS